MPEYLAPGVYVEEKSFRPKTIEGVSTSTAGFVGPARTGPASEEPPLLTSFADFQRIYGGLEDLDFQDDGSSTNYLAYAVRAFFEEGGQRCYVARVFDELEEEDEDDDLNVDGRATRTIGTNDDLVVRARYPGAVGNMRVIFRPGSSRDVSRTDGGDLPGVNLGDTVFAIPGRDTPLAEENSGWTFYDYVLDGEDPALRNSEALSDDRFEADQLEAEDSVFPLRVRVLVQRPLQRPGGGTEFGPEEDLGEFNLNPEGARALADALSEENPAGNPHMTPIVVEELDEDTGTAYAAELFGDDPLVGDPVEGTPTKRPITPADALPDLKFYTLTVPYDESVVAVTGISDGDTITPDVSNVTFTNRVEGTWSDGSLTGPDEEEFTLLNLEVRLLDDVDRDVNVSFELLDDDNNALTLESVDASVDGSKGDWETVPLEVDLGNGDTSGDVASYTFTLTLDDATELAVTGVSVEDTVTPDAADVDLTSEVEVSWSKSNGPVNGKDPLVYLDTRIIGTGAATFPLEGVQLTDTSDNDVDVSLISPSAVEADEAGDLTERSFALEGGHDGNVPTSYVTGGGGALPPEEPEGFDALEDLENVSIVAAPGYTEISDESAALNVQGQLIDHCADMQYRIAVLDTPPNSTLKDARDWRGNIDSTYAAMYYPWITIFDPRTRSELNVPPSGHVAGIYARNDIENGVHKAPANEVVRSAVGFEKRINKRQQDVLNPEGINCFRFFEGRGNRLWGARLATSDNEYKYVNIRRYLAYLERSIDEGTQIFVFENNGADLWRNVRRTIGSFLENEWRSNRLMGTTPEEAYFVKCDRSTMTQNDIDNGRLICEIGVALFRPAEFVIFRIGQKLLSDTG